MSRPRKVDLLLAGLCAALSVAAVGGVPAVASEPVAGAVWWTLPLFLVPAAALLVRRTSPLTCVAGVWIPWRSMLRSPRMRPRASSSSCPSGPPCTRSRPTARVGRLSAGLVVAGASLIVHDVFDPAAWRSDDAAAWAAAFWDLLLFVPPLLGGWVGGVRRASRLAEQNAALERRRLEETEAAVSDERARIARELHDSVTHNVNIVVLQAMAASGVLDDDPTRVREPLASIERSAREALAEMRRMLGVLREVDEPLAPVPRGVEDLDALLVGARETGLRVEITVEGTPQRLPSAMSITIYRVVQESLSNVARHAARSRVAVRVRFEAEAVDVSVVDAGASATAGPTSTGTGFGLVGMRERVAVFGGTLDASPLEDGGFCVHARLPISGVLS